MPDTFDILKDGKTIFLHSSGINWIWYLKAKIVWPHGACTLTIQKHWRLHNIRDKHPKTIGRFYCVENQSRTLCAVTVYLNDTDDIGDTYAVNNPGNIFEYR